MSRISHHNKELLERIASEVAEYTLIDPKACVMGICSMMFPYNESTGAIINPLVKDLRDGETVFINITEQLASLFPIVKVEVTYSKEAGNNGPWLPKMDFKVNRPNKDTWELDHPFGKYTGETILRDSLNMFLTVDANKDYR